MKTKRILSFTSLVSISLLLLLSYSCRNSSGKMSDENKSPEEVLISRIDSLKKLGYPMVDLHAHLKGGLTLDQVLEHSEKTGIEYGVAANCGLGFPITNDSALMAYYHSLEGYPFYKGLQAEGREWINLFTIDSVKKFDYAFTDAMTFTDDKGRRMRLWMPEEVFVDDKQEFMDMLVDRIVGIMENEPILIYVNSTYIPEIISEEYDELWTDERMEKVIQAAVENDIAIEISARLKIPSARFIHKAKDAGVKFTMGTNNTGPELGYLEYPMDMIDECDLEPGDFLVIER